jgi:hypothetical protein
VKEASKELIRGYSVLVLEQKINPSTGSRVGKFTNYRYLYGDE